MTDSSDNLRLVTFEQLMLAQDTAEKSNTFVMRFAIQGELNHQLFSKALAITVPSQPLVNALVDENCERWVLQDEPICLRSELDAANTFQIDLTRENGIKFALQPSHLRGSDPVEELVVVVHHCVMDAIAVLQFVQQISGRVRCTGDSAIDGRRTNAARKKLSMF